MTPDAVIPFSSTILRDIVSTPEMRAIWSERNLLATWMEVEKASTSAQAELGLIPAEAARTIIAHLNVETLSPEAIRAQADRNRHLLVSFLKAFREVCGPAAEHFHVGPTTQDILDTALTLQIREAHVSLLGQCLKLEEVLCDLALAHHDTIMMGRTHEQHALPVTFGLILATWATELRDHITRARESEARWMYGVLSGGVGAQNAFVEMSDTDVADKLQQLFCQKLGLGAPTIDLHPRLDRFAEVVSNLASLCSSLGRIGLNLRSWQRPEVLETEAPYGEEEYSSSTMPGKRNPESVERIEGLASLARCLAQAMQGIPVADHRDSVRIPVEYVAIPMTYMMTSRALATLIPACRGLKVHKEQMIHNLDHPNSFGQAVAERLMIAIYKKTGQRDWAHTLLHDCSQTCYEQGRPLADVVREHPELGKLFDARELAELCDLSTYTGSASAQTVRAVRRIRDLRRQDPPTGG